MNTYVHIYTYIYINSTSPTSSPRQLFHSRRRESEIGEKNLFKRFGRAKRA